MMCILVCGRKLEGFTRNGFVLLIEKGELSIPTGIMRQRRPDSTPVCYLVSSLNESKAKQLCRRNPIGVIKYPSSKKNTTNKLYLY